jgi:cytochrome c-type biogenesis protein CcmH/NrfG
VPVRGADPEPAIVTLARTAMQRGVTALAAQDVAMALRWLERAHRLVPHDPNTKLTFATALLRSDPDQAASLFAAVAEQHDV